MVFHSWYSPRGMWKQPFHLPPLSLSSTQPCLFRYPNHQPRLCGSRKWPQVYSCSLQNHCLHSGLPVSLQALRNEIMVSMWTHHSFWSHSSCWTGWPLMSRKQNRPPCFQSHPNLVMLRRISSHFAINCLLSYLTAKSIRNHMDSLPCPALITLPSKQSTNSPFSPTFSRIIPLCLSTKFVRMSSISGSTAWSTLSLPTTSSKIRDRLLRIMGRAKFRSFLLPGLCLLHLPLLLSLRAKILLQVLTARSLYFYSLVALQSSASPIQAKQSEKMLQGYTSGSPCRLRAKQKFPWASMPWLIMNYAPWMAMSSQDCLLSTLLQSMEKVQTCLPCSHMNLSVSQTRPCSSRHVRNPPCSLSIEFFSQKGTISSSSSLLYSWAQLLSQLILSFMGDE